MPSSKSSDAAPDRLLRSKGSLMPTPYNTTYDRAPQLQLPLLQPPAPQAEGLSQPPSLPQPPCTTPLALGSSYLRQHFSRPHSPDSFDGFKLRSCCFAILIETGSNEFKNVVQHSGRPHVP